MAMVVVIGGSGATGKPLLVELLLCKDIAKVVTVGRRKVDLADCADAINQTKEEESGRLVQHSVDFDSLSVDNAAQYFKGNNVFVSCLGTTRQTAGSAEAFKKIDFGYPLKCAEIAKHCSIHHVVLMSSQGANANSWFLYLNSKGKLENCFKEMGFPILSILRPGMLNRGGATRTFEKVAGLFLEKIDVLVVAKAICQSIVLERSTEDGHHRRGSFIRGFTTGYNLPLARTYEDSVIRQLATEFMPPTATANGGE